MASKVLIFGHSFVKRLQRDLRKRFDTRASRDFNLTGTAHVSLFGVGGCSAAELQASYLHEVRRLSPDVILLEIGTNELTTSPPEVVGSAIDDLVCDLLQNYPVKIIGVCHVIPRRRVYRRSRLFAQRADRLKQYLQGVLGQYPRVVCWTHRHFNHPN